MNGPTTGSRARPKGRKFFGDHRLVQETVLSERALPAGTPDKESWNRKPDRNFRPNDGPGVSCDADQPRL